jgi:hypothetical protein
VQTREPILDNQLARLKHFTWMMNALGADLAPGRFERIVGQPEVGHAEGDQGQLSEIPIPPSNARNLLRGFETQ